MISFTIKIIRILENTKGTRTTRENFAGRTYSWYPPLASTAVCESFNDAVSRTIALYIKKLENRRSIMGKITGSRGQFRLICHVDDLKSDQECVFSRVIARAMRSEFERTQEREKLEKKLFYKTYKTYISNIN